MEDQNCCFCSKFSRSVMFRAMINEKQSQSILVSGRPGQGKQKLNMMYLAYMGGLAATDG